MQNVSAAVGDVLVTASGPGLTTAGLKGTAGTQLKEHEEKNLGEGQMPHSLVHRPAGLLIFSFSRPLAPLPFHLLTDPLARRPAGHGINHARNIRTWIHQYLRDGSLPLHRYGRFHSSILEDEDFAHELQLYLMEISKAEKYIRAEDVVDYVAKPEVQEKLAAVNGGPGKPVTISESARTGRRWLKKLSWRYTRVRKGMYIDGHEREDIVAYRNGFVVHWKEYEKCMTKFDEDGNPIEPQHGFPVPQTGRFKLILVTHDESTFYANDRRKTKWVHESEKVKPLPKGEGSSIMISDFLVPEWHQQKRRIMISQAVSYIAHLVRFSIRSQDNWREFEDPKA
ncbi:uncharacterized protein B0H18DRAFT_1211886 [Fomitopsis serialis]|uniref:uncharacterized protein n=1 Tax=Fomitopsis serialis TaxID=139415 RepID=UPI00200821AC|nr:uncharacterized protein B0H18DRAFT_1211886 [Neoantrodia serialis]KAH9924455.1 hypothetical protein B0H18DRAFT_1211886 [Neoantrodia serialis]